MAIFQHAQVKIDVHMHLAGTGCCASGCWVSPRFRRRHTFVAIRLIHKISRKMMASDVDAVWASRISALVSQSDLDYGVVLGFEGVFDPAKGCLDRPRSQMIIPPEWVFAVCRQHKNLLPGPSINPNDKDALQKLAYCIEEGAVLIKWLPIVQAIDPADKGFGPFYTLLAENGIPLLIHMGGERTFSTVAPELNQVDRLRLPLDCGVKVICAHSATRVLASSEPDQLLALENLLKEYPSLWLDNSGLCNPARFAHIPRLTENPLFVERTLYGSDWPVPSNSFYYLGRLGLKEVWKLERERNLLNRDVAIKRRLGYPDSTLSRACSVLANLDRWITA